jgi:putative peptide zinc metalloprotease protein
VQAASGAGHLAFRADLRIYPPQPDDPDRRLTVYDPVTDLSYYLGNDELQVARLFDGRRSDADVCAWLAARSRRISENKVSAFARRLHALGLLAMPGEAAARRRDPATGISYGPLKTALSIQVMRFAPDDLLDGLYARAAWLCSREFVGTGLMAIAWALTTLVAHWPRFRANVVAVYVHDWHWIAWHYLVIVVSIAVHELGHALACRLYRVRVTDFGIAVYFLLATGWARPLQRDWSALPLRARLVTIAMGPYATLLFVAAGVAFWLMAAPSGWQNTLAVTMIVSATAALVPTLMPFFNGDTYLALTESLGVPRLRQRAFRYVRDWLRGKPERENAPAARRALYWATVVTTAAGWLAAWAWVANTVLRLARAA